MEMTNLLFAFLLGFIVVAGFMAFFTGLQPSYPNATANAGYLANMSNEMNITANQMDVNVINQSIGESLNTQNLNAGAIFGYVTGAINTLSTLIKAPYIFLQMINGFNASLGFPIIPDFVLMAITTGVYLLTLIGILYYLLKVK